MYRPIPENIHDIRNCSTKTFAAKGKYFIVPKSGADVLNIIPINDELKRCGRRGGGPRNGKSFA
mgnify:CR=1 FL=1